MTLAYILQNRLYTYIHANKGCMCVYYVYMGMRHQALMKHEAIGVYVIICGRLNGGKGLQNLQSTDPVFC